MNPFRGIGRKAFIWSVLALVVLQVVAVIAFAVVPSLSPYARHVNYAVAAVLMLLSAERLADAGYPRWVGFAGILVPSIILPVSAIYVLRVPATIVIAYGVYIVAAATALVLAFLIWAACLPSSDRDKDFERDYRSRDGHPPHDRIEPKF